MYSVIMIYNYHSRSTDKQDARTGKQVYTGCYRRCYYTGSGGGGGSASAVYAA